MKVIIIKKYQKYNINDIVEVSDGFAKNFLIKNGYAQPVNSSTLSNRDTVLQHLQEAEEKRIAEAEELKKQLENVLLVFELKVNNNIVHGSITSTAIEKELAKKSIKVPPHTLDSVKITTIGIHGVPVSLHPKVKAFIKVRIDEAK